MPKAQITNLRYSGPRKVSAPPRFKQDKHIIDRQTDEQMHSETGEEVILVRRHVKAGYKKKVSPHY